MEIAVKQITAQTLIVTVQTADSNTYFAFMFQEDDIRI